MLAHGGAMAYSLAPRSVFLADETACASKMRESFCRDPISLLAGWAQSMRESKSNRHRCRFDAPLSQNPAGFVGVERPLQVLLEVHHHSRVQVLELRALQHQHQT